MSYRQARRLLKEDKETAQKARRRQTTNEPTRNLWNLVAPTCNTSHQLSKEEKPRKQQSRKEDSRNDTETSESESKATDEEKKKKTRDTTTTGEKRSLPSPTSEEEETKNEWQQAGRKKRRKNNWRNIKLTSSRVCVRPTYLSAIPVWLARVKG